MNILVYFMPDVFPGVSCGLDNQCGSWFNPEEHERRLEDNIVATNFSNTHKSLSLIRVH